MFIVPLVIWFMIIMVIAVTYKKSKILSSLWMFFISISLMMLSAVVYATKQTSYQYHLGIDYMLYLAFYKIKLNISDILRIYSFSFGLYFFANMIATSVVRRIKIWKLLILMIPAVCFLLCNDPSMSRELYIRAYDNAGLPGEASSWLMKMMPWMNLLIVLFYVLYPLILSIVHFIRSLIRTRRRLILHFEVIVGVLNLFVLATFVRGTFGQILFNTRAEMGIYHMIFQADYTSAPLGLLLVFFLIVFIVLVYPRPFRVLYRIYTNKNMYADASRTSESFSKHLHGDRNFLIALAQYMKVAELNIQNNDPDKAGQHIKNALGMIEEQLNVTNRQMSLTREKHIVLRFENLEEIISEALEKSAIPSDVVCEAEYPEEKLFVIGDREHLTEVFVNIFRNAAEAMKNVSVKTPRIRVRLIAEYNLCCTFITDNGTGIAASDIKSIFRPFYSTKRGFNNSGVGLSYAAEIISKHNGEIFARSRQGEYTEFSVVLPIVIKRKRGVLE